ncbi:ATP-binding protein [bacterium]|nr:ATP-binding protein [bacterium]
MFVRKLLDDIENHLYTNEIIVVYGFLEVGKTTLLSMIKDSYHTDNVAFLSLKDSHTRVLCENGAAALVRFLKQQKGLSPQARFFLFLDDISFVSNPLSLLKQLYELYPYIKLIVSSSIALDFKQERFATLSSHTVSFRLYPFDFEEFVMAKRGGLPSRKDMKKPFIQNELRTMFEEFVLYGGFPRVVSEDEVSKKEIYLRDLIGSVVYTQAKHFAGIRDAMKLYRFLGILSSYSAQLLNVLELAHTSGISKQTVLSYLSFLEDSFFLFLLPPFHRKVSNELYKTPRVFLCDSGMMHLLRYDSLSDRISETAFKTTVHGNLVKNYGVDFVRHWRTQDKKAIDFVVLGKGKPIPIMVSLHAASTKATPLRYFERVYAPKKRISISLDGKLQGRFPEDTNLIRPWENRGGKIIS